jgi:hypothetical protein
MKFLTKIKLNCKPETFIKIYEEEFEKELESLLL